ncbi:uncharacterized protein [Misgurnus anguillicaudatus]|uniref:uncharacterized protein n=1 Tax=Misgurnus anguillicaudatus TaxID=75329 RepID=UPI002435CA00|nr:zinc finger and SCAN domain-containing protein 29-like [Misgurnus anguillicaudatus]
MAGSSNRGQSWSAAEIRCLLDIWADDFINAQLSSTHKNSDVYGVFSKRLREKGFNRTVAQCRIKAKKLRAEYIKIRDALNKTGSDGTEKEKFPWFDELHQILGTKPIVDPVDVVESIDSPASSTVSTTDLSPTDTSFDGGNSSSSNVTTDALNTPSEADVSAAPCAESSDNSSERGKGERLPIPGARARKRKVKSSSTDSEFMTELKRVMEDIHSAEQRQESHFERMLKAQLDAEEKRFREMQAQQQATTQMFFQLMGNIASALNPAQPQTSSVPPWTTTPLPTAPPRAWSVPHQYQQPQPSVPPPAIHSYPHHRGDEHTSTASFLHDLNSQGDYSSL